MPVLRRRELGENNSARAPFWVSDCGRAVLWVGDCRGVLPALEPALAHAVVTDPPYELGFMGRAWDASGVAYDLRTWSAVLRAAKPGAHVLSFGGTRTFHRIACAIEDAGLEIRDCVMWVFGSGFPKGTNISKGIDKVLGAEREVVGQYEGTPGGFGDHRFVFNSQDITVAATDAAREWEGWNTSLKPAWEPIIVARKPPVGSVVSNTLDHGCGGLNIDACRVGTEGGTRAADGSAPSYSNTIYGRGMGGNPHDDNFEGGRWPANLITDGSDAQLSRYFYVAKADHDDRKHMTDAQAHPTVKPLDLMKYLVRLVCPRGGTVLDPFTGTGSTGVAAIEEGMYFVGVEQSEDYAKIAVDRLKVALGAHPHLVKRLESGRVVVKDTPPSPEAW